MRAAEPEKVIRPRGLFKMSVSVSQSPKLYLERLGLRTCRPANASLFSGGRNAVNRIEMAAPWPIPELITPQGDADRGLTEEWPHGFHEVVE